VILSKIMKMDESLCSSSDDDSGVENDEEEKGRGEKILQNL
jgi:hypothetical protein